MLRDIFCVCVCVLKKDDIFIDWSLWSVAGPIVLSIPWLSVGYRQIKSEPTMFVMLSYSWLSLERTPLYLLVWPMLSLCSHDGGSPVIWKSRWVTVVPISSILSPPWFMLNINLVLETFISIIFMFHLWRICWMKELTFFDSCAFGASCRREFEKDCFISSGTIPSQSCMCEVCYGLTGSQPSFHMCP